MEEEIGVSGVQLIESKKFFREPVSGRKFAQLYLGQINSSYKLIPQESEVESLKWFTKDELLKYFEEKPDDFVDFMNDLIEFLNTK